MAWLSGGWNKRIAITQSGTNIDSNLEWFPIPLLINSSAGTGSTDVATPIFTELGTDSRKLAVTLADGTTELYVEIEKWSYDAGTVADSVAVLWASKTGLNTLLAAGGTLYIYYDSSHADNANVNVIGTGNAVSVWDSSHKMVLHNSGASATDIDDSTSNSNDVASGSGTFNQAGKIGNGIDLNGTTNELVIADSSSLDITGSVTLQGWVERDAAALAGFIFKADNGGWVGNNYGIFFRSDDKIRAGFGAATTNYAYAETDSAQLDGSWHHIATVIVAHDDITIYVDGVSVASTITKVGTPSITANALDLRIGGTSTYHVNGMIDEQRVEAAERSAAWIKACFYSQDDNLLAWGSEEADVTYGEVAIDAISSLSALQLRLRPGSSAVSSVASLAIAGSRAAGGVSSINSVSSLAIDGDRLRFVLAAMESISSVSAEGDRVASAIAAINAIASLAIDGHRTASAIAEIQSIASLSADGARTASAIASIVAVASLQSEALRKRYAETAISSSASLAIDANRIASAIVAITAISSLVANASSGSLVYGIAAIQSIASLAIDGNVIASGVADISSIPSLTIDGDRIASAVASLQSIASLTSDATRVQQAIALISSVSSLDIDAIRRLFGATDIEAVSSLISVGQIFKLGAVAIQCITSLLADGHRTASAVAAIQAISSLIAADGSSGVAAIAIAVVTSLTAAGVKVTSGAVTITATSELEAVAIAYITQSLGYTGTLTAGDVLVIDTDAMTVKLNGSSTRHLMTGTFPKLFVGTNELRWQDGGEVPDLDFETKHEPRYL